MKHMLFGLAVSGEERREWIPELGARILGLGTDERPGLSWIELDPPK